MLLEELLARLKEAKTDYAIVAGYELMSDEGREYERLLRLWLAHPQLSKVFVDRRGSLGEWPEHVTHHT
jgi:hypothetical protein